MLAATAVAVVAGCEVRTGDSCALTEGVNPVVSPDGRKLAFQRDAGEETWIGILDLATRKVEWVERGPGRSAFPMWTKSGALVYSHGNELHTAYEVFKGAGPVEGFAIRKYENGRTGDWIKRGKWRDYSPVVTPDEKTVWFCTTRGKGYDGWTGDCESYLGCAEFKEGAEGRSVYRPRSAEIRTESLPEGTKAYKSCGVSQPDVSPDGKTLVWAELRDFDLPWGIVSAPLGDFRTVKRLTPKTMAAYAPRFSPSGKHIAFTGYREGDEGWSVYLMDLANGTSRRVCRGENPSFAPDGKSIVYDHQGVVFRRVLAKADFPATADAVVRELRTYSWNEPERLLWRAEKPVATAPQPQSSDLVFPAGDVFFVRARIRLEKPDETFRHVVAGKYAESVQGFELYFSIRGRAHFATRNSYGDHEFVAAAEPLPSGEHVIVGIRDGEALYVSVDGAVPESKPLVAGEISLLHPEGLHLFGRACGTNTDILSLEIGRGWPKGVPQPKEDD